MDNNRKKLVHAVTLPYPDQKWPQLSTEHEQAVVSLLLPLLQPVGDFRQNHVVRSKGKRRAGKNRPRQEQGTVQESMPEIYGHLTIGFNSTIRRLEALASRRLPSSLLPKSDLERPQNLPATLSAVFVCRGNLPDITTSSLSLQVATSAPRSARARLIPVSPQTEAKIARALNQPRVGLLGVQEDAPDADALLHWVSDNVDLVEIPWLEEVSSSTYLPVTVKTSEIATSPKPKTRKRKGSEMGVG
ncbi:RNase P and RNase MRP subunit [Rhinocladiella similis]